MVVAISGSGDGRLGWLEVGMTSTRVIVIHVWIWLLLGKQVLQLAAITGPDFRAQFVEHLPNGERLLSGPGNGDFNRDRTQMVGRCAHDLAPRRWRARASARSRASLSR